MDSRKVIYFAAIVFTDMPEDHNFSKNLSSLKLLSLTLFVDLMWI